ncbi:MAG: ABC transporter permease [Planctomycetota bacterium]|jgi:putative ABC transport system permease protein
MTLTGAADTALGIPAHTSRRSVIARVVTAPIRFGNWLGGMADRHRQSVATAFVQIWANKARSILTTLGIIIAVTSTITVVSFVQGFGNYVTDMLRGFGTNMVFVIPQFPSGMHGRMARRVVMDIEDVRAVGAQCDKVRRITPLVFSSTTVEYGRQKAENVEVRGATEQFQTIRSFFVDKGRFFSPIDVDNGNHVCVLGRGLLKLLECDEAIVGDYIYLGQSRFRVLGLLEPKGNAMGNNQDDVVMIPYTTAVKMWPFMRQFMPFVIEATSEEDVDEASLQLTRVLRARHNLRPGKPNDFMVLRQDEFLRDFERVKMVATSVLSGIVGISLIVGGIGIMNVMLVSVTERTREIGLRKSIGARRRDIMSQFLTEAVTLATLGGVIGVLLGLSICGIASMHPKMVDIAVPAWVVLLALGFSAGVGILFGMIPAFKAAILPPIDALRHE